MKNKKINKNVFLFSFFIIPISLVIHYFKFLILSPKYFYDSTQILNMLLHDIILDKSYSFVANIFHFFNFLNFTTLQEWSLLITLFFSIILFFLLLKNDKYSLVQYLFIYTSIVFFNIYIFNISKDIIQFVFFLIMYFIILNEKWSNLKKLILISLILLFEAINFRIYYGIMFILIWDIYFIYLKFIKNKKLDRKTVIKIFILAFILFFAEVFIIQLLSANSYNGIMNARYGVNIYRENSLDSLTIINDLLGQNVNFLIFIGNYIINTVRMMIPVELLFKGMKYIPFVIYQIFITFTVFKTCMKLNNKNVMILVTILSYLMVSIIFEPDFGSFIRHESALFPFLLQLTIINKK